MRSLVALVAGLVAAAAAAPPAVATPAWHGGTAPDGILADQLVVESDGTMIATVEPEGVAASVGGGPFRRTPATGLDFGLFVVSLQAVKGGLRLLNDGGQVYSSSDHGRSWHLQTDLQNFQTIVSRARGRSRWASTPPTPTGR